MLTEPGELPILPPSCIQSSRNSNRLHPGRKFPLDGYLVGSLGEAAGETLFDIALRPPSNRGYDAVARDGRTVEIEATYGNRTIAIRPTSHDQQPR